MKRWTTTSAGSSSSSSSWVNRLIVGGLVLVVMALMFNMRLLGISSGGRQTPNRGGSNQDLHSSSVVHKKRTKSSTDGEILGTGQRPEGVKYEDDGQPNTIAIRSGTETTDGKRGIVRHDNTHVDEPRIRIPAPEPDPKSKNKDRAASWPFLTGDGFRSLCKPYIYDETLSKSERSELSRGEGEVVKLFEQMPEGSPVFVQTHLLMEFVDLIHRKVFSRRKSKATGRGGFQYVLLTHNSDFSSPWDNYNNRGKYAATSKSFADQRRYLLSDGTSSNRNDDSSHNAEVVAWFGQNLMWTHPRLLALPIGIENRYNKFGAHAETYLKMAQSYHAFSEREILVFMNFEEKTNPKERGAAKKHIRENFKKELSMLSMPGVSKGKNTPQGKQEALEKFLERISEHKFVVAPHGHGVDTHRFWEALYMGCVPITLKSAMDDSLLALDLPVIIVDSYEIVTPEFLRTKSAELIEKYPKVLTPDGDSLRATQGYVADALGKEFWKRKINEHLL